MRFGWHVHLLGPFSVVGTTWQSKRRRPRWPVYHGTLPGWKCPHNHSRMDLAVACAESEARRRGLDARLRRNPDRTDQGGRQAAARRRRADRPQRSADRPASRTAAIRSTCGALASPGG